MEDTLPAAEIAALAEESYRRTFDDSLIVTGGYGKPGDGWGRQYFYGTHYLGRVHREQFIADSRNWGNA